MRPATISTIVGLTLISGALLAETAGLAGRAHAEFESRFAAYDGDGDGTISIREAKRASAGLHTHFDKFDRDADGELSREEFRRHAEPAMIEG